MFHLFFSQTCFSAEELVLIHSLAKNRSASTGLGRSDLARLSPAFVQQILSGACTNIIEPPKVDELTKTESKCVSGEEEIIFTSLFIKDSGNIPLRLYFLICLIMESR